MSDDDNGMFRRTVLATTGGLAVAGVGSVAGQPEDEPGRGPQERCDDCHEAGNDGGSIDLSEVDGRNDKDEYEEIVEKRRQGDPRDGLSTDVSGANPTMQNLTYVDHWKDESETNPGCAWSSNGTTEGEHVVTVFKVEDEDGYQPTDSDGNYRYLLELWSMQERTDGTGFGCVEPYIERLYNRIETNTDSEYNIFHYRDPATKGPVNDERLTVRHSYTIGDVGYSSEEVVRFDDGYFGADTWTPGPEGEYAIEWTENDDNLAQVDMIGFVDIGLSNPDFDFDDNSGLSWRWKVETDP